MKVTANLRPIPHRRLTTDDEARERSSVGDSGGQREPVSGHDVLAAHVLILIEQAGDEGMQHLVEELRARLRNLRPYDIVRFMARDDGQTDAIANAFQDAVPYGAFSLVHRRADRNSTWRWTSRSRRAGAKDQGAESPYLLLAVRAIDLASVLPLFRTQAEATLEEVARTCQEGHLRLHKPQSQRPRCGKFARPVNRPAQQTDHSVSADVYQHDRLPRHVLALSWRCPWHPEAGGAEVMLLEHMRRWARRGHEVTLLAPLFPGAPREEVRDGLRIVRRGGRFTVYAWAAVLYLARFRKRTDSIVDVENGIPFFSPLYARKSVVCLVHHVHQRQFITEFGPILGQVGRFLEGTVMPVVYRNKPFMVVSESTRTDLQQLGVDGERIRIVHNGVDHDAYDFLGEESDVPRLLYLGRLKRQKRIDLLIELCAHLRIDFPDLVLDIVGIGDDEGRLRALARQLGVSDSVRFHGFVSHARKVQFYSEAWALVIASEREGWGLTTVEAAACGTPTLCLDAPGVRDAVKTGMSGWVAVDMRELREVARRFLSDVGWRERLSRGARERAATFSWSASAAAGRAAVIDARLAHHGIQGRRSVSGKQVVSMVYRRESIPAAAWSIVANVVLSEIRAHDRVALFAEGLCVDISGADEDVRAVRNRISATIDRLSRVDWPNVFVHPSATAVDRTVEQDIGPSPNCESLPPRAVAARAHPGLAIERTGLRRVNLVD